MKTLIAIVLLCCASAHAIPIEDDATRLVFDLTWSSPNMFGIQLYGDCRGSGGSDILVLDGTSSNPFRYVIEVHRRVDGVALSWWGFSLLFQGWDESGVSRPPDPVFGTSTAPRIGGVFGIPQDHWFTAVAGNDHAVRVIVGALPVPEEDSLIVLAFAGGLVIGMLCCMADGKQTP